MTTCEMLRKLPGSEYSKMEEFYQNEFSALLKAMQSAISNNTGLATLDIFRDYERYCRWPIRMLEYGFALKALQNDKAGKALDVGSGVTPWPYQLARSGWETTAVDPIVEEVTAMKRHGSDTYGASVRHLMADARGLAFADNSFDLVTSISVIEHVPAWDTAVMLSELVRVCRPGGRLVLTTDILASDTPFTEAESFTVEAFAARFSTLASACGGGDVFAKLCTDLEGTSFDDLAEFWTAHKPCGLWEEDNRGYHAVGLNFVIPDEDKKQQLVDALVALSLSSEFNNQNGTYETFEMPDAAPLLMPQDSSLAESLQSGTFEQDVDAFFNDFVKEGDVVFDVGANVGHYSRMLGKLVGDSGYLHAFEPAAKPYQCLVRNTLTAGLRVHRNKFALSSENGSREIFLGAGHNEALNSFGEPFGIGKAADGSYEHETVWMMSMDAYASEYDITRIDLAKIDVEGWEEQVVRGGVQMLQQYHPVLLLEYCSPAACNAGSSCLQLSELLVSLGYNLYRYLPEKRDLESVDERRDAWAFANLVAVPAGHLQQTLARLKGEPLPNIVDSASAGATDDKVLQLKLENERLLSQVDSEAIDREVAALTSESNARMAYIETLHEQVESLKSQLEISEDDRTARLQVIEQQDAALKQLQNHPVVKIGTKLMSIFRKADKH